jgi:hypothetical protein
MKKITIYGSLPIDITATVPDNFDDYDEEAVAQVINKFFRANPSLKTRNRKKDFFYSEIVVK